MARYKSDVPYARVGINNKSSPVDDHLHDLDKMNLPSSSARCSFAIKREMVDDEYICGLSVSETFGGSIIEFQRILKIVTDINGNVILIAV